MVTLTLEFKLQLYVDPENTCTQSELITSVSTLVLVGRLNTHAHGAVHINIVISVECEAPSCLFPDPPSI